MVSAPSRGWRSPLVRPRLTYMPRRPGPSAAVLVGMLAAAVGTGAATARAATPIAVMELPEGHGSRYPARKARDRIGAERCRKAVSTLSYRFGWPAKAAWRAGDRTLVCYSRTTS